MGVTAGWQRSPEINPNNPSAYTLSHTNTNICYRTSVFSTWLLVGTAGLQAPSGQSGCCGMIHAASGGGQLSSSGQRSTLVRQLFVNMPETVTAWWEVGGPLNAEDKQEELRPEITCCLR